MRVRLVIDVLNGEVVRGVAGRRDEYRPVESVLTRSTRPADIAAAFRDELGITSIYVADLDGLVHGRPNPGLLAELVDAGFDVLADTGVRNDTDLATIAATGVAGVIVALETLESPDLLSEFARHIEPERLVVGLDLREGRPIASAAWPTDPLAVADRLLVDGVSRMIVLDLAAVGVGRGVPTLDLCRSIRARHPGVRLVTGGGVRSVDDLRQLEAAALDEALVASSVHDGSLGRTALAAWCD